MPRKYSVTRTGKITLVEALIINKETETLETRSIAVDGEFTDTKKLEKACRKEVDNDTYKFVSIKSKRVQKERRGMTTTEWYQHSHILAPNDVDEDNEAEEAEEAEKE